MKQKHTPGPWTLGAGRSFTTSSGEFYISYGKDKHGNALFKDFCELDANARLIARAPEMAELLEDVSRWLDVALSRGQIHRGTGNRDGDLVTQLHALLDSIGGTE